MSTIYTNVEYIALDEVRRERMFKRRKEMKGIESTLKRIY
jgi:hypothetical protein